MSFMKEKKIAKESGDLSDWDEDSDDGDGKATLISKPRHR